MTGQLCDILHVFVLATLLAPLACETEKGPGPVPSGRVTAVATGSFAPATASASAALAPTVMPTPRCAPDMVRVTPVDARSFCVDRYEAMLVDSVTNARISPYYAPNRRRATYAAKVWASKRYEVGGAKAKAMALPALPAWQLQKDFVPRAVVRKGVTPNGHTSGAQAKVACENAGKRLCSAHEWRTACGGEQRRQFPYGDKFVWRKCNVFREAHPADKLHDNASIGHNDPRLNKVQFKGKPLLRRTGATPACASQWGDDAIHDMVGNLDEWLDDPEGVFAGGFYARSSKDGCDWKATGHSFDYADYSTGVRCCADLPMVSAPATITDP